MDQFKRTSALIVAGAMVGVTLIPVVASAQSACPDMSTATAEIRARYDGQFKELEDDAARMQEGFDKPSAPGAMIGVDFKVDWVDQRWVFDLPSISIRDHRMVFGTPSVTMRTQDIIFHTPSVRMKTVKCGQYPEFHGFSVTWTDIKCDVPEPFMEEQRISMDVPEFFMEEQAIIMGVPEFEMHRQEWVVRVPEFTVINVNAEINDLKDEGEALRTKSEQTALAMKSELASAISAGFDCYEHNLVSARNNLAVQMDLAIQQMNLGVQQVQANGGDPTAVGGNLVARRDELVAQKDVQLNKMDQAIADLQAKERQAIERLSPVQPVA